MLTVSVDGVERRFDTGDSVVDELLRQLDHYARGYGSISSASVLDSWLSGVINVSEVLPPPYRGRVRASNFYIGDMHHRWDHSYLAGEAKALQSRLSDALESIIADETISGRSNTYVTESGVMHQRYGNRDNVAYPKIERSQETTGEAISKLCARLSRMRHFEASPETLEILREIRELGNSDIRLNAKAIEGLVKKKRIADLSAHRVRVLGYIMRIENTAEWWHRRKPYSY